MPLLLQSLQAPEPSLQHGTLEILKVVIEIDHNMLLLHLPSIFPNLLAISAIHKVVRPPPPPPLCKA